MRLATDDRVREWKGKTVTARLPLGYDLVEKKLVVNEPEAERVRAIFALYLELGSLLLVADELRRSGWMPKVWTTKTPRRRALLG